MSSDVVLDATPQEVTPVAGKGALGAWRYQAGPRTLSRAEAESRSRYEPGRRPWSEGVYACQRLSFADGGKASGGKPRSEPDSGKPTVRDRRGASGNVAKGAGLRPIAKAVD